MNPLFAQALVVIALLALLLIGALLCSGLLGGNQDDGALYECRACETTFETRSEYVAHANGHGAQVR